MICAQPSCVTTLATFESRINELSRRLQRGIEYPAEEGSQQWSAGATGANENIPSPHHRAKAPLKERSIKYPLVSPLFGFSNSVRARCVPELVVMESVDSYGGFLACQYGKERRLVKRVGGFDQKVERDDLTLTGEAPSFF